MVDLALYGLAGLVILSWLLLAFGPRKSRKATVRKPIAVLDGSNVMHWKDRTPRLPPVTEVLRRLETLGYEPGVVFDANAGYRLTDHYIDDDGFAKQLKLSPDMVLVVPRGEQADPFLLRFASDNDAVIISNDRFRDRIADFPRMAEPGRLVRGGYRDGALWLDIGPAAPPPTAAHGH